MAVPRSVNRCIAVAAHGRRCQQSTYRGSPYCWHHTQSRKVWAPSRTQAAVRRPVPTVEVIPPDPGIIPPARLRPVTAPAETAEVADRVARLLSAEHLDALAEFLEAGADGVFRVEIVEARVVSARRDPRLSRTLSARRAAG